ncbi:hypothetical protein M0L71_003905 [Escherichia coli]|nr:hypothetical protein [Escherichia coli]EKW8841546.1 hypothetical protein [Escherichia coli]
MDFSEYQTEIIEDIKSCLEGLQVQPILFMGAGVSQRYLKAPDWENLLKYLAETCPLITRPYGYYSQTRNDNKPMLPYDFEMLKNIAEQDNVLAKLYGIAELNNGQALNASYPYTISELAKLLDMGSWHYVHKVLERIHKETGFNIKSSDNNYHVLVKTGKEGVHKYSPAAFELIKKIINGQKYKLKP